jgi:hypothetical protein
VSESVIRIDKRPNLLHASVGEHEQSPLSILDGQYLEVLSGVEAKLARVVALSVREVVHADRHLSVFKDRSASYIPGSEESLDKL